MQLNIIISQVYRCVTALLITSFFLLNTLTATYVNADELSFVWAKPMGGEGNDFAEDISIDDFGNVYTTGCFSGTSDFDPGDNIYNLSSHGIEADIFISKLDSKGNFVWAKAIGGFTFVDCSNGIFIDNLGNVYITGMFWGPVDFDPGDGVHILLNDDSSDIFICKLDTNGNFVWARSMAGGFFGEGASISVDNSGNVFTTGRYGGTVDFDPGEDVYDLTSAGDGDIFVSKLDSSGNFNWAKTIGGGADDYGESISVDSFGSVYTTGRFEGTVDFDPGAGTYNLSSVNEDDIFVSKLDANGDFVWAGGFFGGSWNDTGRSIFVDNFNNVYTTGTFGGTIDFNPGDGVYYLTAIGTDIFVSKLDSNGHFIWAKAFGGTSTDEGYDISVDDAGNVFTTGMFEGTIDVNQGTAEGNLTSVGGRDIFISKLDSNGDFIWAGAMGGAGNDEGRGISVDEFGNVYVAGRFEETADFDPGNTTYNLTSIGIEDIFVSKFEDPGPFYLSVTVSWNGVVTSILSGISCPPDCSEIYKKNTAVTLKAVPSSGAIFGSWSGSGCKGTGDCTVTMDRDRKVGANFGKEGEIPWSMLLLKKQQ